LWIYGLNPVIELLRHRPRKVSEIRFDRKQGSLEQIFEIAEKYSIPIKQSTKNELTNICGSQAHQGIIAKAPMPQYLELDRVFAAIKQTAHALIIILDSITDPQNLGSIIRVAETAGAEAVIIPKDRASALTPAVAKASAGALEWIPVCRVTNLRRAIESLKENQFWVMATSSLEGEVPWEVDLTGRVALVIGSEGKGIRPGVAAACDRMLRIPLRGKVSSLNASVSAGVFTFEILRQRQMAKASEKT
jgi:23S rRNA (guanosine2251-2'-O)-methyltransferase